MHPQDAEHAATRSSLPARRHRHEGLRDRRRPGNAAHDDRRRESAHHPGRRRDPGRRSPRGRGGARISSISPKRGLEPIPVRVRILAIDPGKVRLGLAISDADRNIASPLSTYTRKTLEADGIFLGRLVKEEEVGALLVGLPVRNDGHEESRQEACPRLFGSQLESWTGLPVRFWDERYTSAHADTIMAGAGLTRAKQKERRDRVAARFCCSRFSTRAVRQRMPRWARGQRINRSTGLLPRNCCGVITAMPPKRVQCEQIRITCENPTRPAADRQFEELVVLRIPAKAVTFSVISICAASRMSAARNSNRFPSGTYVSNFGRRSTSSSSWSVDSETRSLPRVVARSNA